MNTEEIGEKIKKAFTRGAEVSKDALEKAGDKVQEFSDKSLIRIEKKQLESKRDHKYMELGKMIYDLMEAGNVSVNASEEEVAALKNEIKKYSEEILQKEDLLK